MESAPARAIHYSFPLPCNLGFFGRKKLVSLIKNAGSERLYRVGPFWACESPESHVGASRWAIDFLAPDGTPVLASANGVVVAMKLDSREWGPTAEFADKANYIVIDHGGEFSQYCHLAFPRPRIAEKFSAMHVGREVRRGDIIGYVGKTGWTTIDHLHFMVFRREAGPDGFKSIPVELQ